jgi:hypothetical protein
MPICIQRLLFVKIVVERARRRDLLGAFPEGNGLLGKKASNIPSSWFSASTTTKLNSVRTAYGTFAFLTGSMISLIPEIPNKRLRRRLFRNEASRDSVESEQDSAQMLISARNQGELSSRSDRAYDSYSHQPL